MAQSSWYNNSGREGWGEWSSSSSSSSAADNDASKWRGAGESEHRWSPWWAGWEQPRSEGWSWIFRPQWWVRSDALHVVPEGEEGGDYYTLPDAGVPVAGGTWDDENWPKARGGENEASNASGRREYWPWREEDEDSNASSDDVVPPTYWQHKQDVRKCVRIAKSR